MARFRFNLDPLLKARRIAEQQQQRVVAQLERERMELEEVLRRYQAGIAEGKESMREQLIGTLHAHSLRMQAASSMQLMRKAQRTVLELAGVHKRLEAARAALIEATRRRRAVELLRERRLEEWKLAQDKAETAALDELATIAAARQAVDDRE